MVRATVQQLLHKTYNFISPELWSPQARGELNWLQDLESLQQREYELQVNKTEKNQPAIGWTLEKQ